MTPKTPNGQLFTIFYAAFGIPLCLFTLATYGNLTTLLLKTVIFRVEEKFRKTRTVTHLQLKLFALQVLVFSVNMLLIGALYKQVEGWSYIESVYAWFVTITTIGFGDFEPTPKGKVYYWIMYFILALLNLSMLASMIELLVERLQENRPQTKSKLGLLANVLGFYGNPRLVAPYYEDKGESSKIYLA